MPIDEDTLRRIIREEVAAALAGVAPVRLNGHHVDPALSAKRAAASRARWGTTVPGSRAVRLAVARLNGTHTEKEWIGLLEILDYRCVKCGAHGVVKDHIRPVRLLGASDAIGNIQPMCRRCNTGKGGEEVDRRPPDWRRKLDEWLMQNQSNEYEKVVDGTVIYPRKIENAPAVDQSKITPKRTRRAPTLSTDLPTGDGAAPEQTPATRAFRGYAEAYVKRYGEFPVRNAKSNALLKQLVDRLGAADAAEVAGYYVGLDERLYAGSGHALALLVRDAEKIRTLWRQRATTTVASAQARPWWEVWSAIEEQGGELGIEPGDNPTLFKNAVLRAAYVAGRLPDPVAERLGVDTTPPPGA